MQIQFSLSAEKDGKILKNAKFTIVGDGSDLIKLLAAACDVIELREILRMAVDLDTVHNEKVGRRYNYHLENDKYN